MLGVDQDDLKYEWGFTEDNPLIRFYRMAWGKNAPLSFCSIFWGTLFSWVAIAGTLLAFVLTPPIKLVKRGLKHRRSRKASKKIAAITTPAKKQERDAAILNWIVLKGTKLVMGLKSVKRFARRMATTRVAHKVFRGLAIIGVISLIGGIGVGLYFGIPLLFTIPWSFWWKALAVIGGTVAMAVMTLSIVASSFWIHSEGYDKKAGRIASLPIVRAWGLFALCYRVVKTNTCPRIVLIDESDGS